MSIKCFRHLEKYRNQHMNTCTHISFLCLFQKILKGTEMFANTDITLSSSNVMTFLKLPPMDVHSLIQLCVDLE